MMTPEEANDFYEEDEDPAGVFAKFKAGAKGTTRPPDIKELDFSRFHPMDHRPWACWQRNAWQPVYGKTWTHLKYGWDFKWRGELRAATLCRIGIRHRYGTAWRRSGGPGSEMVPVVPDHCIFCYKDKPS